MPRPTRFDILTLFPEVFEPVLGSSITGRARASGLVEWNITDIRRYADNKHHKVDDRPFGGGPGMVMMCQPLWDCVMAVEAMDDRPTSRVLLTPQGERLSQPIVEELSKLPRLLLIAGHYEGIDERVIERLSPREISVGDFVLSGGEIPALALVDAVVRLLPGALGDEGSAAEDSFSPRGAAGQRLLDCPHYTRPRVWEGMEVPEVLVSGDHAKVDDWRMKQMLERTTQRRPDLLTNHD
ncbi:MAG TPA: tRNA (guanosine(37)-N1)-methyltransferase TrmD [Phycisphaerales bacterium]|nr:tRNA (guanosine(37)-N1)-methyltransferase TrmD [Phycisphaerales bacterium]